MRRTLFLITALLTFVLGVTLVSLQRRMLNSLVILACSLTVLAFIDVPAQSQTKATKPPLVKCWIEINSTTISPGKAAIVSVTIENVSSSELKIDVIYSFELLVKSGQAVARDFHVLGDSYWGPVDSSSCTSLVPLNGRVPTVLLHLTPGEAKCFKFDLRSLLWNASMSSIWPHEDLFDVVPKGNYWLVFNVWTGVITSNKVDVVVE